MKWQQGLENSKISMPCKLKVVANLQISGIISDILCEVKANKWN